MSTNLPLDLPRFTVDAVAFDLDGTLVDSVRDLACALNLMLAENGLPALDTAIVADLVGKGTANLVRRAIVAVRGDEPRAGELAHLLERFESHYAQALGRETVPYPDAAATLETLRSAGYRLAVVTNKPRRFVEPHLDAAGIGAYFDVVVGGGDTTARKPDAEPLRFAAERLGVVPAHMLMVGDSANDAQAARAAGCPVVLVPYGYREGMPVESIECDGIVASLSAVVALVRRTV